ncbi:signal transduction histidine kinase [Solitalea canadensis DSM 3403]|uniref:histidine kinase n=1 Tax=Solitalea canadensis (strain ATCC 29591 / DSM 3403 / JCM 21819 / LMG 8368 / NBRC 15130 / NCIMB 12057 / USAM 9D) TaxID=929556 RepID=H8KNB1_SOLCM|nr:signal transduction histidine kinase [Solitalea canadensis DSM 3403]
MSLRFLTPHKGAFFLLVSFLISALGAYSKPEFPNNSFSFYEDNTLQTTAEQALSLYKSQKFNLTTDHELNIGFTKSVYWLAFNYSATDQPQLMQIGNSHINKIDFYYISDNKPELQFVTGDYYNFNQRPIATTGFNFPLKKEGLYLIRIDKHNESLQLSFNTATTIEVLENEKYDTAVIALFSGMIILLALFACYLSILSKSSLYILYALYACSGWIWVLANSGHGFEFLWPNAPNFASKARPIFTLLPIAFSISFVQHYLGGINQKFVRTTLHWVRNISYVLSFLIICVPLQIMQTTSWMVMLHSLTVILAIYVSLILYLSISQSIKGNKLALFYLVAIASLLIMLMLFISFYYGDDNANGTFIGRFGLAVGYILELVILMAGLAYRFNRFRIDKEELLTEMNRKQAENTRIIMNVQETERNQIANQLHDIAGSLLSAAKLNLSSLRDKNNFHSVEVNEKLEKTEEAVSLVSDTVRNLSHALSPVMLSKVGFKTSIEKVVSIFNASGKINFQLVVIGFNSFDNNLTNYYTNIYSIVYELLNNISKHSQAKNALIQLIEHEDSFSLIAEDDGIGFDPEVAQTRNTHGLSAIVSKVNYFEGYIELEKNEPCGSIITIDIPKKAYAI